MTINLSSINLNIKSGYKYLSVSTLLSAFAQITLGGFVRTSESGLGCPDWPLCYGQIIPPMDFHTWVEWSHRLNASVLMMLVFALCFFTLIQYKNIRVLTNFSVTNVILVIITAILGGITVITELAWWVRLIHLALAQSLIACLTVMTWYSFSMPHINKIEHFPDVKRSLHSTFGAIALQVIIGAWVIWSGFNGHIKTAHLSLATVVWVATIYFSVVIYYSVSKNNKNL